MNDIFLKTYFEYLNDAEDLTTDFKYRHWDPTAKVELGCYRWKGVYQYKDFINEKLKSGMCVDFGGAASPIGNCVIVDQLQTDSTGKPITFKTIDSINSDIDFIFSSHTLEHILDVEGTLKLMNQKLTTDGSIFLHLPAYTCKRWLPSVHHNPTYGDHQWSFSLSGDTKAPEHRNLEIDKLVSRYFNITKSGYVGDNSIVIIANK